MAKTTKEPLKPTKKTFSLTAEEKAHIQNLQNVLGILRLQREGVNDSITLALSKVRARLGVSAIAPDGYTRMYDLDSDTYEFMVIDTPIMDPTTVIQEAPKQTN